MRKIAVSDETDIDPLEKEKRQRKKWSTEETKMLVVGCNRHGVGNWKDILSDPSLIFDNRSPVDLKDRFRTYFPDAYKQHYPNARTHLSSKVRSTLPDGTSIFEKTRSKRRRPFTEEEDRALKAGYERHGTVWATIVKDPVFRDQARRSTDLRDRFRNAFPELYQAAGYKPRNATSSGPKTKAKKTFGKQAGRGLGVGGRAATDDQLVMSSTGAGMEMGDAGPVRSRRRAQTTGILRGGTKSVPQSTACSEDEDSDSGVDELDPEEYLELPSAAFKSPPTPVLVDNVSTLPTRRFGGLTVGAGNNMKAGKCAVDDPFADEMDLDMVRLEQLSDPLATIPVFASGRNQNTSEMDTPAQAWSGIDTPTHSHQAWSTAAGSPTSSHLSTDYEYLLNSGTHSHSHSPSFSHAHRNHDTNNNTNNTDSSSMIGKSAWGTQDWLFSSNPRLDHSSASTSNSSSYLSPDANAHSHSLSLSPPPFSLAFPFTHHSLTSSHSHHSSHLNLTTHTHGVLDRYDLLPASSSLSLSQHVHMHDFASDIGASGGGADEFSDADAEFPPSGFRGFTHHSNYAGDLIFGARGPGSGLGVGPGHGYYGGSTAGGTSTFDYGLGLSGMGGGGGGGGGGGIQMQLALPGIDEIEIAGITLEDQRQRGQEESHQPSAADGDVVIKSPGADSSDAGADTGGGDLNVEVGHKHNLTRQQQPQGKDGPRRPTLVHSHSLSHLNANSQSSHPNLDLDDFVDFSRSQHADDGSELGLDLELHATPPGTPLLASLSTFSGAHTGLSASSRPRSARRSSESTEFLDYHNYHHHDQHHHGRSISVPPSEARARAGSGGVAMGSRLGGEPERQNLSGKGALGSNDINGSGRNSGDPPVAAAPAQPQPQQALPLSFPSSQMLLSAVSQDTWGSMAGALPAAGDINLSFLDLHYYGGVGSQGIMADADMLNRHNGWGGSGRQGQALDLAAPPSSLTSTSLRALGIPASLRQHIPQLAAGAGGGVVSRTGVGVGGAGPGGKVTGTGGRNSGGFHQRGQSAVCPKDLVLKSGDNKRKRASWDGAHV